MIVTQTKDVAFALGFVLSQAAGAACSSGHDYFVG